MRKITLMSGIPGSGKSTVAESLMRGSVNRPVMVGCSSNERPENVIVSADHFFTSKQPGGGMEYTFNPALLGDAHGLCLKSYIRAVQGWSIRASNFTEHFTPEHIVVDNTNVTTLELAPYIAIAQAHKIPVEVYTINVREQDVHLASTRNSHGVPHVAVKRMWQTLSERSFPFHWQAKFGVTFCDIGAEFR